MQDLNNLYFTLFVYLGSFFAGLLGSLTGLGGGVIVVPMLTVLFGVDIHFAAGASLISVIANGPLDLIVIIYPLAVQFQL